jgi:hypothetical protein
VIQFIVGALIVASVIILPLSIREFLYLRHLKRQATNEDLWLLDAIRVVSGYLTFTAIYFVTLVAFNTFYQSLTETFPPLRIVTSLVLLGVITLPVYLGREMRRRRAGPRQTLLDSLNRK